MRFAQILAAEVGDPIFDKGNYLWGMPLFIIVLKAVIAVVICLLCVILMIWAERKVISDMQDRIGPNRAGPWGLLQTLADGTKLFFKESLFPEKADLKVFRLAPYLSAIPAFLTFAVIPLGGEVSLFGHKTILQLADPPMGVLFSLAISSIAVYGVMLAGWSSGSKYPLIGSVRASAQMISYEAAMGLSLAAVVLTTGSLSTQAIVKAQQGGRWNLWNLLFVPAIVFAIAGTAELNRPPFDLVEAESELVGGFHTEYTSARFAMFYLAEFMNTITMSALIATLFLGGPTMPFNLGAWIQGHIGWAERLGPLHWILEAFSRVVGQSSPLWLLLKVMALCFTYIWMRGTLPRYRYDQLMDLGWKRLIPASLLWLLILAARQAGGSRIAQFRNTIIGLVVAAGVAGLLRAAMKVGRRTSDEEMAAASSTAPTGKRPGRF
jgi:NADH-quinone oxidoreductase subunit H